GRPPEQTGRCLSNPPVGVILRPPPAPIHHRKERAMGLFSKDKPGTEPPAAGDPDFEPIAGVSIELYAEIAKGLAAYNYDQSKGRELAAAKGVSAESWQAAVDGWNARMQSNRAVGQRFNALYMGRA